MSFNTSITIAFFFAHYHPCKILIVIIEAIASTAPRKINPINRCASNATMSKGVIKRNTPISSIADAIFSTIFFFSSFIFLYFALSLFQERVIKFKDYLMFRPKNKQTLLRISTLNKFLHVFYNHKYYSFYI